MLTPLGGGAGAALVLVDPPDPADPEVVVPLPAVLAVVDLAEALVLAAFDVPDELHPAAATVKRRATARGVARRAPRVQGSGRGGVIDRFDACRAGGSSGTG